MTPNAIPTKTTGDAGSMLLQNENVVLVPQNAYHEDSEQQNKGQHGVQLAAEQHAAEQHVVQLAAEQHPPVVKEWNETFQY